MNRPRVYCDFNDRIDTATFGLRVRGTVEDLERQQLRLCPGLELTLYDYDAFDNGDSAWIVADAVVVDEGSIGLAARVHGNSFRWEPRREHEARIRWSDDQVRRGLPTIERTIDPSWFIDGASDEGWSLVCEFRLAPREQGSPSLAHVHFAVDGAPHDRLRSGVSLRLFERETQSYATVEILN
jgi:hypothetical protein